jgi:predicted GTPase
MGAAGRDFHNFNVAFRNDPTRRVLAFPAAQIPGIDGRRYPAALAGPRYPDGIPIYAEAELPQLLRDLDVDEVVFAYSDVTDGEVMELAAVAGAGGAGFRLLGPRSTMLATTKPVVSVCAVRTGCGKSQTVRVLADVLVKRGKRVAVVRHPMPYGDLVAQRCQRFETVADLDRH